MLGSLFEEIWKALKYFKGHPAMYHCIFALNFHPETHLHVCMALVFIASLTDNISVCFSKEREHNFFSAGHCSYYSSLLNNVSQFLKMDLHESIFLHLKLLLAMKNRTEKRINVHIVHLPFGHFLFLSFPSLPTNPKTSQFCLV